MRLHPPGTEQIELAGLNCRQFGEALFERFGKGRAHAREAFRRFFTTGSLTVEELAGLPMWRESPKLVAAAGPHIDASLLPVLARVQEGNTVKFRLQLRDGNFCECVVIPMPYGHSLCVSSQVGCAMGCRFCQTARMGLVRHMSAAEIVQQVLAARFIEQRDIRKVVFMGMGEAFDNFDNVVQAIRVLCDSDGLAFKYEEITLSTVGRLDGIRKLGELMNRSRAGEDTGFHRINLAVSLNAPDDERRSAIMPINRAMPMAELREALLAFPKRKCQPILFQYVLLAGLNDGPDAVDAIVAFTAGLRAAINVIPYNPIEDSQFAAPTEEATLEFVDALAPAAALPRRA